MVVLLLMRVSFSAKDVRAFEECSPRPLPAFKDYVRAALYEKLARDVHSPFAGHVVRPVPTIDSDSSGEGGL